MAGSNILLAEDDQTISHMYGRILAKKGFTVDFAYTGTEALDKATNNKYDLLLLDIMMPEMTGIQVLTKLREKKGPNADVRVLILTNLAQDKISQEALKAKADGYIVKADIVPSQLAELVSEVLK